MDSPTQSANDAQGTRWSSLNRISD